MAAKGRPVRVQRHKSGLYFANVGPPKNGRATPIYFPREAVKTEAQAWRYLDRLLAEREAGRVDAQSPTVFGLCQLYLAWAEDRRDRGLLDKAEYARIASRLTLFREWAGGDGTAFRDMRAAELTPEHVAAAVESWLTAAPKPYKPTYIAGVVRAIKGVYGWASRRQPGRRPEHILPANPIRDAKLPVIPHAPERFAARREIAAFLRFFRAYADGAHRGYKGEKKPRTHKGRKSIECRFDRLTVLCERFMIHTGARPGEVCNAWWSDVKWDAGRTPAGLPFAKVVIPPERWKAGRKTGRARTIYVSPILTRALRREFERTDHHPVHIFAHRCGPRDRLRGSERLTGAPWDSGGLAKKIRKVRRLAIAALAEVVRKEAEDRGETLTEAEVLDRVILKDEGANRLVNYRWRHTAISTLLMMGIDVATVAELAGTSADMIRRHYGHLLDQHLARAAALFHSGKRKI
jgi:integrase